MKAKKALEILQYISVFDIVWVTSTQTASEGVSKLKLALMTMFQPLVSL